MKNEFLIEQMALHGENRYYWKKKTKNYEKMYNTSPRVLYGEFTHYLYLVVDFKLPQIFGSFNFFPSNCQSKLLPNTTSLTFTFFFFYNTHQIFF